MMKNKKGFTLIELLVVVLIIGVLAAIALPQYRLAVDKARYATLMDITRAIAEANERFYMVHDKYSTKFNELDVDIQANSIEGADAYFDWGNCHLFYQQEVQCTNDTSLKNQFIRYYNRSTTSSRRGGNFCTAQGLKKDSRYDKVCKSVGDFMNNIYSTSNTGCLFSGNYWTDCRVYAIRR